MNKTVSSIVFVILSLLVVACSPGGSTNKVAAGGTPTATTGSVFGNAPPGTIVGLVCILTTDEKKKGLTCPPPVSVLVGADGKYKFPIGKAIGSYDTYFSLGGHRSELGSPRCGFTVNGNTGGLFDCQVFDTNPDPIVFTPANSVGLTFSDNGIVSNLRRIEDSHVSNGLVVAGAQSLISGKSYEWGDGKGKTVNLEAGLRYDALHDTIYFYVTSIDQSGMNVLFDDYAEIRCGVSADILINESWYYKCSRLGVTFDRTRGVISFETTPTYWWAYGVPNFPFAMDIFDFMPREASRRSIVSGSLTFPPF